MPDDRGALDDLKSVLLRQLALAFDRRSWHGPNLMGSVRGVSFEAACYRPQPRRHNIWEIVVHCAYWKYRVCRALSESTPRAFTLKGADWFERPADNTRRAWQEDLALLREWHEILREAVGVCTAGRLNRSRPGSEFTTLDLISGAAAHDVYHAGQIRLLRRLQAGGA